MDVFEERILFVLQDGKPRFFTQLLDEVGFSHNTLKLHIKRLLTEGLLAREKTYPEGLGRPKFAYSISPNLKKQVSAALQDSSITIVTLPFTRLRHLCRFEKGGYCKEVRKDCNSQNCPQLSKVRD
jgi:predicted ArsR family transcriptional regulator